MLLEKVGRKKKEVKLKVPVLRFFFFFLNFSNFRSSSFTTQKANGNNLSHDYSMKNKERKDKSEEREMSEIMDKAKYVDKTPVKSTK